MKKTIAILIAAALAICCLAGCGNSNRQAAAGTAKFKVVTTIFPEYDWVMNVLGDNPGEAEVTMLLDSGIDLHSYQPTADDIMKISSCDLFIYVGGESDEWVDDALKEATNKNMVVIDLLDVLGDAVKEEEVIEGMQEEEHDHDHGDEDDHDEDEHDEDHEEGEDHDEHDHEEGEIEYDEHVWLSLRNADLFVKVISDAVKKLDTEHADTYAKNASDYIAKLDSLDAEYKAAVDGAAFKTLLFGDRFPFRYLVDDYGLDYYAAFVGCSAETEASFETVTFLSKKVDELALPAVMTIEGTDHRIAETVVSNTQTKDQKILTMDSLQSTTAKDVQGGTTYLSVMEKNLEVLKEALGK